MTAHDDYPVLAAVATSVRCREAIEAGEALDEIDLLRAAVNTRDSADIDFRGAKP